MSEIQTVGLIGRFGGASGASNPELFRTISSIIVWLTESGYDVRVHNDTINDFKERFNDAGNWCSDPSKIIRARTDQLNACDVVVVVGGDGTMLHAVHTLDHPALIGVNLGRVGFITDIPSKHAGAVVRDLIRHPEFGKVRQFGLLEGIAYKAGYKENEDFEFIVDRILNEFSITRATSKLLELEVFINHAHAFHVRADGLLVSTPTGSTAYSLAAGGSIMAPGEDLLQIVPMMPQTLAHRPLIVPGRDRVIKVAVKQGLAKVEADGREMGRLDVGDEINIYYSSDRVTMLKSPGYSYYDTLRTKLNWHLEAGTKPHENY